MPKLQTVPNMPHYWKAVASVPHFKLMDFYIWIKCETVPCASLHQDSTPLQAAKRMDWQRSVQYRVEPQMLGQCLDYLM